MSKKQRRVQEDDFSFEDSRRRKTKRKQGGSGKAVWLILIGGLLVAGGVTAAVVLLNTEEKGAPAKVPEILAGKKTPETPRQRVSKESQEWKDRFFRITPGRTLQEIDEAMHASFRPLAVDEVVKFFDDRSDRESALKDFRANIERLRVKQWYSWTRGRDVFLAGFSQFKDGNRYMTMRGVYLEPEKSTFFIMTLPVTLDSLARERREGTDAAVVLARTEDPG